jgi:hypothetical protein
MEESLILISQSHSTSSFGALDRSGPYQTNLRISAA